MTEAAVTDTASRRVRRPSIFNDRRRLAMLLLGVASGLPFTVVGGTLAAWFTAGGISTATIGVLSWSALSYSFNFLWSPALHRTAAPFLSRFGRRKSWFIPLQILIALALFGFSALDPKSNLLAIAALAVLASFLSATFDIVLAAWRIETAQNQDDIDALSTLNQVGYRAAAFVGGAGALILSDLVGWSFTLMILAAIMALTVGGALLAPEPPRPETREKDAAGVMREPEKLAAGFSPEWRNIVVALVIIGWIWAFWTLGSFMIGALSHPETAKAGAFTLSRGPWIVAVTVLGPALGAIWLLRTRAKPVKLGLPSAPPKVQAVADALFGAVVEPMVELIGRLRWVALLAVSVILTYRFADNIWGSFAYPFYMGANGGALGHTATEVALASKMIGVAATITGLALGGVLLKWMGRMPALVFGAAAAAATNLLFADLAIGAVGMDAFLSFTHLSSLFGAFGLDIRMARLCTAIMGENLAVGIASVVYVAYLTSIVNPKYAAVQYALLGSLTMLVGQLGRPALGAMIDAQGFYPVFLLTAALGMIPVVLSAAEWHRRSRLPKADVETVVPAAAE